MISSMKRCLQMMGYFIGARQSGPLWEKLKNVRLGGKKGGVICDWQSQEK
jgi:hypothetical protein